MINGRLATIVLLLILPAAGAAAQVPPSGATVPHPAVSTTNSATEPADPSETADSTGVQIAKCLGGAATGLGLHELGHILAGASVGAELRLKKVDFKGIPFFAITHVANLSRRQEYAVSAAGFWAQYAASEWILSANPNLRSEKRRFQEGVLAFHIGTSLMYAGAAFAKAGPYERDTRGMAESLGISERWIGVLVLLPAVLDTYRYFHPDAEWAAWASRGVKLTMVGLTFK